jgi:hypothetical protein
VCGGPCGVDEGKEGVVLWRDRDEVLAVAIEVRHVEADASTNLVDGVGVPGDKATVEKALVVKGSLETLALMVAMDGFNNLLEADGDDDAKGDGGDVDEELSPGESGVRSRMNVDHMWPEDLNL